MANKTLLKQLGKHIRKLRLEKGLSQKNFAHDIGKDQQSIQRLEAGNVNPSFEYLHEVATGLGISCEKLFRGFKP